jgi:hypothetical protein
VTARARELVNSLASWDRGQMRRRLRGREESADSILLSIAQNLLAVLQTGKPLSDDGLKEILEGTGLIALAQEHLPGHGPISPTLMDDLKPILRQARLARLRVTFERAPWEELERARDRVQLLARFLPAWRIVVTVLFDLPEAFGLGPMATALDSEVACVRMVPFIWLAANLSGEEKAQEFFGAIQWFNENVADSAMLVGSLTPEQQRRFKLKDPSLRADLTASQLEALSLVSQRVTVNGQASDFHDGMIE